jgi:hypothetical protein
VEKANRTVRAVMLVVFGTVFCLLVGFFFFRFNIFKLRLTTFEFVVSGLSGSIFYAVLRHSTRRVAILTLAALLVLDVLLLCKGKVDFIVGHVLYFLATGGALYLYSAYIRDRFRAIRIGKFVALAILLALFNGVLSLVYGAIISEPNAWKGLLWFIELQLLIGAGLGLGLEIAGLFGLDVVPAALGKE